MNLRESSDHTGFPKRDLVPARILVDYTTDCTQAEYTARCCAFFAAIFQALQQDLSSKLPSLRSSSTDAVVKEWNDKMCDMRSAARTEFFEIVKSRYQATLDQIKIPKESTDVAAAKKESSSSSKLKPSKVALEKTISQLGNLSLKGSKSKPHKETTNVTPTSEKTLTDEKVEVPKLEGESFLIDAFQEMVATMPRIFTVLKAGGKGKAGEGDSDNEPKLVIAFDEAHPLSKMSSKGFRPSHILGRVINSYSRNNDAPVWVVFASTTSQVAHFSAPQEIHDSQRVAVAGQLLYPPYTDLGWDQLAIPLRRISANDVAKFHHIVGFGRPLWKLHVQDKVVNGVMELAAQKLCKSKSFDPRVTNQALAVLSQRFGLDICFGHPDAVSHIEAGVASHLRVCFSTTEDRIWSFTGYPSEPFLSCVAAILLHETPNCLLQALLVLREKVDSGMVEIGQSGELTSRLLLLLAKDLFIRQNPSEDAIQDLRYNRSEDAELLDCQKVSVIEFLVYLFGTTFWSKAGEEAKAAFRHAYINFSHWVPMTEFISPACDLEHTAKESKCDAQEWTLRHWHRTSAVQCCHLQPLVDKMIPIYFDDPALGPDDEKRVSQIFISDKAGKRRHVQELSHITRGHETIDCQSVLPYIALLLDLNVVLDPQLKVSFPERNPSHSETGRCLRIYASGMSDTTFPFLHEYPDVKRQLQGLLSRQKETASETALQALVKFGSTARSRNLRWEAQQESQLEP
ncbi:uncharacterized protein BJ212DRAFT_602435 [Suillus subaureus]|uniref:Uncharacterized protein n=1 Tax=Suillus subaureus TaxID=48587 RepID=A0A9P7E2F5_9AGAM|nr:uncharacterized protein BJ212DRAFT_602435 [Suillus subaureus]KAG1809295.1 hypothetical protein BJ212DRAFT_602435 [Suillus subaureus]